VNDKCRQNTECRTRDRPRKTKYMIVERKNTLKQNKIGHLKIKDYKFERAENFKYLGVILDEDSNHQIQLKKG
jgi:hypothetical protein